MKLSLETKSIEEVEIPQFIVDTIKQIGKDNRITAIKLLRGYLDEKHPGIISLLGAKNSVESILLPREYPGHIPNGVSIKIHSEVK